MNIAAHWSLDPAVDYLNHGSFGACPITVLEQQSSLRAELEREPVDFLISKLPARLDAARAALAEFIGASPEDTAFVANATAGVNAVLRSIDFAPGDELLLTDHTYAACRKTVDYVVERSGARAVIAHLPFPLTDPAAIVAAVRAAVSPRTRIALLDHVTSPTALILPIAELVRALADAGVDTLVDGAHAPGMVPLALDRLGAAYYTGNAHKWLCAPKGAAFLHVRKDRQASVHPNAISHGYGSGFRAEFDWTGTCDPTPWLCIPLALRTLSGLVPGGWPALMAANRALALKARAHLLKRFDLAAPCPDDMVGAMASIPLTRAVASASRSFDRDRLHDWFRARNIETWFYSAPCPLLRISAQLYNSLEQFERLAALLPEALHAA